ncbi:Fe(2+) transporter [Kappamyces sp. JEL0680]|nr:Fe(2+) transporter [Kappamyces sp. JEL0680]
MEFKMSKSPESAPEVLAAEDEIDYESIPNSSHTVNMVAGALAGITEHVVTYPLDVLKTRMQFSSSITENVLSYMSKVYTTEGLRAFSRGLNTVVLSAGPAHALYFGAYEACKEQFVGWDKSEDHHVSHAAAGAVATVFHDGLVTPFDGMLFIGC